MQLTNYRRCSWREKREVLELFWRSTTPSPSPILTAAREYGPYAIVAHLIIVSELVLFIVIGLARHSSLVWFSVTAEALVVAALVRAIQRQRLLVSISG
jgi:hypothetical protein